MRPYNLREYWHTPKDRKDKFYSLKPASVFHVLEKAAWRYPRELGCKFSRRPNLLHDELRSWFGHLFASHSSTTSICWKLNGLVTEKRAFCSAHGRWPSPVNLIKLMVQLVVCRTCDFQPFIASFIASRFLTFTTIDVFNLFVSSLNRRVAKRAPNQTPSISRLGHRALSRSQWRDTLTAIYMPNCSVLICEAHVGLLWSFDINFKWCILSRTVFKTES